MSITNLKLSQHNIDNIKTKLSKSGINTNNIEVLLNDNFIKTFQYLSPHPNNNHLSIEDKAAYFNSYMKSRMDFLSDIATGTPTMETSKLFYDELMYGFDKNRILLDDISGVDNFKYKILIHDCRKCDKENGKNCTIIDCDNGINSENDFSVSIPNDILGQHAFYIIIENIIRNTAKHSSPGQNQELINFHIEIREPNSFLCNEFPSLIGLYEVHIYDDVNFKKENVNLEEEEKKLFEKNKVILKNNKIDKLEKLIYIQNIRINQTILDENNKLRRGAWGLIEMDASASYLRKLPVEIIDDAKYDLFLNDIDGSEYSISNDDYNSIDILKAFVKTTKSDSRHLAYRFFMLKPKEILVVLDDLSLKKIKNGNKEISSYINGLINFGIWCVYKGNKDNSIEKFDENKIYEHEILLNLTKEDINQKFGSLPDRIVKLESEIDLNQINDLTKAKEFKEKVWKKYACDKELYKIQVECEGDTETDTTYGFNYNLDCGNDNDKIKAKFIDHGNKWSEHIYNDWKNNGGKNYVDLSINTNNIKLILNKINTRNNGKSDLINYVKLCESVNSKVIILDERIQEAAFSLKYYPKKGEPIPFDQWYLTTGVYVPPVCVFNLSEKDFKKNKVENFVGYIKNIIHKESIKIDNKVLHFKKIKYLVIHLGIIEKCLNAIGKNKDNETDISEFIGSISNNNLIIKPIIVSGRGQPPNVPKNNNISFLNYSNLSQYNIDLRNKFLLNELLISTKKII